VHADDRHKNPGDRRIFAEFLVFDDVPENPRPGLVFGFAGNCAGHAADAFFKVNDHPVSHIWLLFSGLSYFAL
jgi:hypothetical protein